MRIQRWEGLGFNAVSHPSPRVREQLVLRRGNRNIHLDYVYVDHPHVSFLAKFIVCQGNNAECVDCKM